MAKKRTTRAATVAEKKTAATKSATEKKTSAFQPKKADDIFKVADPEVHLMGGKQICITESRGYPTPKNRSPTEIVVDASDGFIPLWDKNVILRWRFDEMSMRYFQNPDAAKNGIRHLFGEALLLWGDSVPVKFQETQDNWDFQFVMRNADRCTISGCTLASAFFPDRGRHDLTLYPKMFTQSRKEQVDTMTHELGHVFGLRHFFAQVSETAWPSVIFGAHKPFSIMNYGSNSELTADDKSDLSELYQKVWEGELTEINGTPIVKVRPYHELGAAVLTSLR